MRIKNTEFRVEGLRCFKLLPLKIYEKPKWIISLKTHNKLLI